MEKVYRGLLRKEIPLPEQYETMYSRFRHLYGGRLIFLCGTLLLPFAFQQGFRWILLSLAAGFAAIAAIPHINPHYFAAFAAFLALGWVQGARIVSTWRPLGSTATATAICLLAALLLLQLPRRAFLPIDTYKPWALQRQSVIDTLAASGERHLVLVKYDEQHSFYQEWVYNPAEFSTASVLFARYWTPKRNRDLAHAYPDRKIWVLHPDRSLQLAPYEPSLNSE